jgi:hypothetical protein
MKHSGKKEKLDSLTNYVDQILMEKKNREQLLLSQITQGLVEIETISNEIDRLKKIIEKLND